MIARLFIVAFLLAGQAHGKDPFYGEYIESEQRKTTCLSRLAALGKDVRKNLGLVTLGVLTVGGIGWGVVLVRNIEAREAAVREREEFKQVVAQPWNESTVGIDAEKFAKKELEALQATARTTSDYRLKDNLMFEMRKFADIWHSHRGENVAMKNGSLLDFLEIRKATIVRMMEENSGASLFEQMGHGPYDKFHVDPDDKELFLLHADAQRVLALPAYSADRPSEYQDLLANVLATIEKGAVDHVNEKWNSEWSANWRTRNQFSESAAAQQKKIAADFIATKFDAQYGTKPDSESKRPRILVLAALRKALSKSKPGQTVAQCLKENGIELFSLRTQELFDLFYAEEVLSR